MAGADSTEKIYNILKLKIKLEYMQTNHILYQWQWRIRLQTKMQVLKNIKTKLINNFNELIKKMTHQWQWSSS